MSPLIQVQPLSRNKRRLVFISALLLFLVAVPVSVFYAIGYRFDFSDKLNSIKSVGGLYVRNDIENTEMFVNDAPVVDMRVFQKAAYIQNLTAGMHRVHVQGDLVQTWVKELPVYAHFVTEVASFNVPKVPQIRILTPWFDAISGESIVFDTATSSEFNFASTTNILRFSSTTATTTFVANSEYQYIRSLFASSTELKQILTLQTKTATPKKPTFNVATSSARLIVATTTKSYQNVTLFEKGDDVYISWGGDSQNIPYYYCVQYTDAETTTLEYGVHVYLSLQNQFASSTDLDVHEGERICRDHIRIDRLNQDITWFDFHPDSTDLVLMLLEDGLYVVEADDRSWQNTQLLYPGRKLDAVQDGGRIFVHDGEYYLEVFTEMASSQ